MCVQFVRIPCVGHCHAKLMLHTKFPPPTCLPLIEPFPEVPYASQLQADRAHSTYTRLCFPQSPIPSGVVSPPPELLWSVAPLLLFRLPLLPGPAFLTTILAATDSVPSFQTPFPSFFFFYLSFVLLCHDFLALSAGDSPMAVFRHGSFACRFLHSVDHSNSLVLPCFAAVAPFIDLVFFFFFCSPCWARDGPNLPTSFIGLCRHSPILPSS